MEIRAGGLDSPEVAALLGEHLRDMHRHTPPESIHALDLDSLRRPEITFWSAWGEGGLMGCGALKQLDPQHGEIKSMRTAPGVFGFASMRAAISPPFSGRMVDSATSSAWGSIPAKSSALKRPATIR